PKAVRKGGLRRVLEDALRLREVGPGISQVTGAAWKLAPPHRLAQDLADRLGDAVDARRRAGGDVEDLAVRALGVTGSDRRVDDVADEREVARLLAVAVDDDLLAG